MAEEFDEDFDAWKEELACQLIKVCQDFAGDIDEEKLYAKLKRIIDEGLE